MGMSRLPEWSSRDPPSDGLISQSVAFLGSKFLFCIVIQFISSCSSTVLDIFFSLLIDGVIRQQPKPNHTMARLMTEKLKSENHAVPTTQWIQEVVG